MCGRHRRKSDKQRIAEAFQVRVNLDDLNFSAGDDLTPAVFSQSCSQTTKVIAALG